MLIHPTLEQLRQLGLAGMARAFEELADNARGAELDHAEWLGLLLDREIVKSLPIPTPNSRPILTPHWVLLRAYRRSTAPWACGANGAGCPFASPWIGVGVVSHEAARRNDRLSMAG